MADPRRRRQENAAGDFFVDSTCIDCDTCRWMAPETFREDGGASAVHAQPRTGEARLRALQALIACPTASIGTVEKAADMAAAVASFPIRITDEVYHCGYHAESSFGATSYFIRRPEGNVMVDSPRFAAPLVRRLKELGGIDLMFLTHRDDVADHARFAEEFGCRRVIHADDVVRSTRDVEQKLEGVEPLALADDLKAIPVPGHTKGHMVLLYQDRFLFTGDHLAWSDSKSRLVAFRRACWYSWPEQIVSMRRLLSERFEWVLPGHGRRHQGTVGEMHRSLEACIEWMERAH